MEEIQILISSFKGFSKHTGKSKLTDKLLEIGSYTNGRIIEKIRALVRDGKKEEAALVKKQLKGSTLSATYKERRVPEMIDTYNDLQMMDLDGLSEEEMTNCRKLITGSPNTLFCFTSPSGNGLKVGVCRTNFPAACAWNCCAAVKSVTKHWKLTTNRCLPMPRSITRHFAA